MSLLTLVTAQFADLNLKENFKRITDYIEMHSLLHGYKFLQFEIDEATESLSIKHGLGYIPQDIIRLKYIGDGQLKFHRELFDAQSIVVGSTGPCKVRMLIGSKAGSTKQSLLDEYPLEVWDSETSHPTATSDVYSADTAPLLIHEDFLGDSTDGVMGWVSASTGASLQFVSAAVTAATRALGVLEMDTGTTATGRAALRNSTVEGVLFGFAAMEYDARFAVNTAKPTSAEAYMCHFGFGDHFDNGLGTSNATDGVYFVIDQTSDFIQCRTSDNGVRTTVVTGLTIPAPGTFARYRILVAEDGSNAKFYVNEALLATITDNIPVGAGRWTGFGAKLMKTNGTTLRAVWFDYIAFKATYSSAR